MTREFIYLPTFESKWKKLGLTDDDAFRLEHELLSNPLVGKVIEGTGGIRKMRFAVKGKGKSGSTRVIYIDFQVHKEIFFLDVYQKSDKEDLSDHEKSQLKKLVEFIEEQSDTTGKSGGLICPLKAVDVQPPKGGAA